MNIFIKWFILCLQEVNKMDVTVERENANIKDNIGKYLEDNNYTVKEFAEKADVSISTVKKWLYGDSVPSRRMMGKLKNVSGLFGEREKKNDVNYNRIDTTLAEYLTQIAKNVTIEKAKGKELLVKIRIDEESLFGPLNLNKDYKETQKFLDKVHYEITDEDIKKAKAKTTI